MEEVCGKLERIVVRNVAAAAQQVTCGNLISHDLQHGSESGWIPAHHIMFPM
jgi:hypothetical protein